MSKLALYGGNPIRSRRFESLPLIDANEIESVQELLRRGSLSKFIGSPANDAKEMLKIKSSEDTNYSSKTKTFLGGKEIRRFETLLATKFNVDYCISVNSATSGLITALKALPKDYRNEIITTPFSFTASSAAIELAEYKTIFSDIDLETFCLSPEFISINKNIKGILYVSWCGNAGDLCDICDFAALADIFLVEDASQSIGSKYQDEFIGTIGDIGVFSFNEPKNIMTGEGGVILTNNKGLAIRCRLIRNHGEVIPEDNEEWLHDIMGYNFRLTELQAAIGIEQLDKLEYLNDIRKKNYEYLKRELINNFGEYLIPQKITNSEYYPYTASFRWIEDKIGRDKIAKALIFEGIPVSIGPPRLLCDHPYYKKYYKYISVPNARKLQKQYLGFYQVGRPNLLSDMDDIIKAFKKILDNKKELI